MPGSEDAAAKRLASLEAELAPDMEVIRLLGTGRMAEVYLARQVSLDRLVAVKVLAPSIAKDESARARFHREARAAASLESPHTVSVFRSGRLGDGTPYLVMQYVRGGTLEDRLRAEGPLSEAQARGILGATAEALGAAHAQDFVHRDVRAANILCDRDTGRSLLSDFGLAGIRPEGRARDARITRTGEIVGTPGYLSPEQLKGETATEATDVFALGLLGYELLAGQGPFAGKNRRDTIVRSLKSPPTPLLHLRPDVDPKLADLLERCLAKEPEHRPTADYLARSFRDESGEEGSSPVSGRDGGDGDVLQSLLKRRLPQIVVATGVVLYAILSFVQMLAEQGVVPGWTFEVALTTFVCGVAASGVVAWFHGKKGRQQVTALEIALLTVLCVLWLGLSVFVALSP